MDEKLPFADILENPVDSLTRLARIIFIGLMIGVFLPGLSFYSLGTFSTSQIMAKLKPDILYRIKKEAEAKDALERRSEALKEKLLTDKSLAPQDVVSTLTAYYSIEKHIEDFKPKLYVAPMFPDPLFIVWPLFYISFLLILTELGPSCKIEMPPKTMVLFVLCCWLLYRWPSWMRNTSLLNDADRRVFAGTNFDISPASFLVQEVQAFVVIFLFSLFLMRWASYIAYCNRLLSIKVRKRQVSNFLLTQFMYWQCVSILLAIAFVPYTYFFWRYVVDIKDQRYLPQAFIMQTMYGLAWLLASTPLLMTWYKWQTQFGEKYRTPKDKPQEEGAPENEAMLLEDAESPLSMPHVTLSAAAAVFAFISPFLKAALHL